MTTSTTRAATSSSELLDRWRRLRRAALTVLVANVAIIMTGSVVRITGSGLGCPDWPTCEGGSVVPRAETAEWHTFVEFGNRLMSFVVLAAAAWVLVAAWRATSAARQAGRAGVDADGVRPGRDHRGIRALALVQVGGVLVQALLGGITVLSGLSPPVVAVHLLASMVLVAAAVVLHERAAVLADPDRAEALGPDRVALLRPLAWLAVAAAGVVLILGTLVTGAGPHSGGEPGTARLPFDIRTLAVAHADAVWFLVAATVAVLLVARSTGAGRVVVAAGVLLGLEVAQGVLGYAQYALGVPPVPVVFHVLGATLVWIAAWRLVMAVSSGGTRGLPTRA